MRRRARAARKGRASPSKGREDQGRAHVRRGGEAQGDGHARLRAAGNAPAIHLYARASKGRRFVNACRSPVRAATRRRALLFFGAKNGMVQKQGGGSRATRDSPAQRRRGPQDARQGVCEAWRVDGRGRPRQRKEGAAEPPERGRAGVRCRRARAVACSVSRTARSRVCSGRLVEPRRAGWLNLGAYGCLTPRRGDRPNSKQVG